MKYVGPSLLDASDKIYNVDGHQHVRAEVSDMPTKLSDFINDLGIGEGISEMDIINLKRKIRVGGM